MTNPKLDALSAQIETEHAAVLGAESTALDHAIQCGHLLLEAKASVGHGGWLPWIEANLTLQPRQVQKYCRLAEHEDDVRNASSGAHLNINDALALLAEPRVTIVAVRGTTEHRQIIAPVYERSPHQSLGVISPVVQQSAEPTQTAARCDIAEQRARAITDLVERMERCAGIYGPDAVEAAISAYRRPDRLGDLNKVVGAATWQMARPKGPTSVN
jgi:hypothetical protein